MEYNKKYYLVDRYYCFLVDGLANQAVNSMFISFKSTSHPISRLHILIKIEMYAGSHLSFLARLQAMFKSNSAPAH